MSPFVWLTDLHLNHCDGRHVEQFLSTVADKKPDALWITGDFGESTHLLMNLDQIATTFRCPIYFVLGNHDFYFSSITTVRRDAREFSELHDHVHYLTDHRPIPLADRVSIIGDDGWADARIGDYERSNVMLNDYLLIEELSDVSKEERRRLLERLGDEAAARIRRALTDALASSDHVILLTHVPPMREACWHEGRLSDDEWAPHFTCRAMGDTLLEVMEANPDCRLTVLCGHTHSSGHCRPLDNVMIWTGAAEYGNPGIAGCFDDRFARIPEPGVPDIPWKD